MNEYWVFAVLYISHAICQESQTENQPTEIRTRKVDINVEGKAKPWTRESQDEICKQAKDVSVQSVYVGELYIQLFIDSLDGARGWTVYTTGLKWSGDKYPKYIPQSSRRKQLGLFMKSLESGNHKDDGQFQRISASFVRFSNSTEEKAYLVSGLSAHEFVFRNNYYWPSGKVKPITDFFKDDAKKLLKPEDKLEEVVSVALIKWVEKDKIKDHAIYKIILKTATKKLVKAYFKITSKGEVISLNSEPFLPSVEVMQDEVKFNLLEESALYFVRKVNKLSMGYQFTSKFGFPIYCDYNPDTNTYKEYPMRTKTGFNAELEALGDKVPYWHRYIVPAETWLGCPETTFCLGRSFDAVFYTGNRYYAIFDKLVYTLINPTSAPGTGLPLESLFPIHGHSRVDAAFTLGAMIFFIDRDWVHYITESGEPKANLQIADVFPGIDEHSVSAIITLDKENEAKEVTQNKHSASKQKSLRLRKYLKREEREAKTTNEDIPKKMVYVYLTTNDGGKVYQYEMVNKVPPKFKRIAKKTYNEVNAALPLHISLAFTTEGKVVTMVNHFMTKQSSQTFFTQTENLAKFTLVDKYFGCQREKVENELTKEFVQEYERFAGPKPGVNAFADPADTHSSETVSLTSQTEGTHGSSSKSAQIGNATSFIQAMVIIIFHKIYYK